MSTQLTQHQLTGFIKDVIGHTKACIIKTSCEDGHMDAYSAKQASLAAKDIMQVDCGCINFFDTDSNPIAFISFVTEYSSKHKKAVAEVNNYSEKLFDFMDDLH